MANRVIESDVDVISLLNGVSACGSLDASFRLLADRRRRIIVETVLERTESRVPVADLVETIARREDGTDRESIVVDLYHRQLPKLAESDVIEYDSSEDTVRYEEDEAGAAHLERATTAEGELLEGEHGAVTGNR